MAILTMDGFDSAISWSDVIYQDPFWTARSSAAMKPDQGRWGGGALDVRGGTTSAFGLQAANINSSFGINLQAGAKFSVRLHFRATNPSSSARLVRVSYNPNSATVYDMASLVTGNDGSLNLWYYDASNAAQQLEIFPAGTIVDGAYYYMAMDVQGETSSSANDGWITTRLNGSLVTVTDVSFISSTTHFFLGYGYTGTELLVDDVVIADHFMTDLIPHRIHSLAPNADRAQADFAPSSGTDGYAMVADSPHDGDTSYVVANTVGDASEYDYGDMPAALGVYALKFHAVAKRDTSGTTDARHELRLNTNTMLAGNDQVLLDDTYRFEKSGILEENPDTTSPFTEADVNGLYSRHEVI